MKKTILTMAMIPALAFVGCNPSALDGKGTTTLQFESSKTNARELARTSHNDVTVDVIGSSGEAAGSITLTEAWVVIKEIELEHETDDENATDDELEIEFIGPYAVDLLSGTTYPELPAVSIDTGLYNDIEIDIEKLEQNDLQGMPNLPQGISDKLLNYSLYLDGNYTSEDESTYVNIPFTLLYRQTDEFELSGTAFSNGFVVDDTGINDIIVAFRLNEWFRFDNDETNGAGTELTDAVRQDANSDYVMYLDDGDGQSNDDSVLDVIRDNIEDSAEYGEDDNDDDSLDEEEDDD